MKTAVKLLKDLSEESILSIGEKIRLRQFAHKLIDGAAVDLIHGRSPIMSGVLRSAGISWSSTAAATS